MKICILGGTGYLGNHIVESLLKDNNEMFCICRRNSKSVKNFEGSPQVKYIISDFIILRELFAKEKFDCIINASCTYIKGARIDDIVESNLIFPTRVLSLAVENYYHVDSNDNFYTRIRNKKQQIHNLRFISIGTGLPDNFNIYTYTKKQFNKMGHFFSNEYGLEFVNIELENYFGNNEPQNRFIPTLIEKLKNNEDMPLTQGEQLRDFVYVYDVINAISLFVYKKDMPPYLDVPLGSGDAPSIKEMAIYIKELLNSKSELQFGKVPLRPNEPSSYANLSLYKMLGGHIEYSWKEGIKKMLKDYKLI